jgi:hypothetical protein
MRGALCPHGSPAALAPQVVADWRLRGAARPVPPAWAASSTARGPARMPFGAARVGADGRPLSMRHRVVAPWHGHARPTARPHLCSSKPRSGGMRRSRTNCRPHHFPRVFKDRQNVWVKTRFGALGCAIYPHPRPLSHFGRGVTSANVQGIRWRSIDMANSFSVRL